MNYYGRVVSCDTDNQKIYEYTEKVNDLTMYCLKQIDSVDILEMNSRDMRHFKEAFDKFKEVLNQDIDLIVGMDRQITELNKEIKDLKDELKELKKETNE